MSDGETEGRPPEESKDNLIRLLRKENTELRTQLHALGRMQPVEANYDPPWWYGLFRWARLDRATKENR